MREAAQGGGEMAPPELVRTFYETVVSQHRLEDLPRFVGEGCVLRQGEWTTPLGPGGMVRHLAALRRRIRITRSASSASTGPRRMSSPSVLWRGPTWALGPEQSPRENA